jgi:hypothetical protein
MLLHKNLEAYVEHQRQQLDFLLDQNLPEVGIITKVLGPNPDPSKVTNKYGYSVTHEVPELRIDYLGIHGDRHRAGYRERTGREKMLYPAGTIIRQHRHLFAVSPSDCDELTKLVGTPVTPELLGANLVIAREDGQEYSLSEVPQGTYLLIADPSMTAHRDAGVLRQATGLRRDGKGDPGSMRYRWDDQEVRQ